MDNFLSQIVKPDKRNVKGIHRSDTIIPFMYHQINPINTRCGELGIFYRNICEQLFQFTGLLRLFKFQTNQPGGKDQYEDGCGYGSPDCDRTLIYAHVASCFSLTFHYNPNLIIAVLGRKVKKEVIAFANTKGGTIYIGIEDDGKIVGVQEPSERICEQISSMIHDGIKPDVTMFVKITAERLENEEVVKIDVQRGTKRPYYLADKGFKPSGVYVRLGNTSVPATENYIRSMIIETEGTSYEQMRSMEQELTFQMADSEFKKRELPFEISQQKTLGIMDPDGIYTNLGFLLSDQCQHSIKAAVFKGKEKAEFLTRKEFSGSLFKQIEEAYSFIDLANHLRSTFEGLSRIDRRDYSEISIREALLNAVIHRDYSFGGSTLISIFEDRMEFVSLGGLAPGLEIDDIFEGISQSRNPRLSEVFYRLNYVEAYGTGIRKIQSECERNGVEAEFRVSNAAFRTILPNSNFSLQQDIYPKDADQNTRIEEEVFHYLRSHKTASRKEIQKAFDLRQTKSGLILKTLEDRGLIKKHGAGRKSAQKDKEKIKEVPTLKKNAEKLIEIISENPFQNPPPYEKLSCSLKDLYSRRINRQHRLVYKVLEEEKTIIIVSMWLHYEF